MSWERRKIIFAHFDFDVVKSDTSLIWNFKSHYFERLNVSNSVKNRNEDI